MRYNRIIESESETEEPLSNRLIFYFHQFFSMLTTVEGTKVK